MSTSEFDKQDQAGIQDSSNFIYVPLCYQETEYTCGVTCVQSLLARYGMIYRQSALTDILHSQPIVGTDIDNILSFAQLLGFKASLYEDMEIDDLKNYIIAGISPLLILQAWKDDEIEYPLDWKNSHYIIACGYYNNGIYAMDPNVLGNYSYIPYSSLVKRWHYADKSGKHHTKTGLILEYENCPVKYNPSAIKYID